MYYLTVCTPVSLLEKLPVTSTAYMYMPIYTCVPRDNFNSTHEINYIPIICYIIYIDNYEQVVTVK